MSESSEPKVLRLPDRQAERLRDTVARMLQYRDNGDRFSVSEEEKAEPKETTTSGIRKVPLDRIIASPFQTRDIDAAEKELDELCESIKSKGVLQPIILRPQASAQDSFELVAGERRFRAAERLGLNEIPAIIENLSDRESIEISIIENAQRENLNPVEEALAYHLLSEDFSLKQAEIAEATGKSRVAVTNALRLLKLEEEILEFLRKGFLSAGHGRVLLALKDSKKRIQFAKKVVAEELSVRALEALVEKVVVQKKLSSEESQERARLERQANRLRDTLEMDAISLRRDKKGRKTLQLTFETEASWKRFLARVR